MSSHSPIAKVGRLQKSLDKLTISRKKCIRTGDMKGKPYAQNRHQCTQNSTISAKAPISVIQRSTLKKAPPSVHSDSDSDESDDDIIFNKNVKVQYRDRVVLDFSLLTIPEKKHILNEGYNGFTKTISGMQINSLWNEKEQAAVAKVSVGDGLLKAKPQQKSRSKTRRQIKQIKI